MSAAAPAGSRSELTVRVNGVAWSSARRCMPTRLPTKCTVCVLTTTPTRPSSLATAKWAHVCRPEPKMCVPLTAAALDWTVKWARYADIAQKRPFGVRDVTNPVSADGAEDPETLDGARDNAPLTVRTLDRIVSLRDYEDFARGFAGIGKAQAVALWDGMRELVHITLSDPTGQPVPAGTLDDLKTAVAEARDPLRTVCYGSHEARSFRVTARVLIDEAYLRNDVEAAITALLLQAFSFEKRAFGQVVTSAEILALIHTVPGVIAVDLGRCTPIYSPPAH